MSTMPQLEPKEPTIGFRCSEEQKRRIKVAAAERDISIQEMMLQAIEMYLEEPLGDSHG